MKKLMIALTAVAATALVAKAEETDLGGSDFNKMTTGAFDVNVQESSEAYGEASYWALPEGATSESQVVEASADDKYLKIEEAAVLERKINPTGTVDIPENGGSIVISSKVQFTASEDEGVAVDSTAKLAVWLRKLDGENTPKLMVLSRDGEGNLLTNTTDAVVVDQSTNPDKWYTLKVVSKLDPTTSLVKFQLSIDDTPVNDGAWFNSLVRGGDDKSTIASVGFKGTGAVDDIAFTSFEGEVAVPVTLAATVNGAAPEEGVVAIMMGDDEVAEANVGETVKIVVDAKADATVAADGLNFNYDEENGAWIAEYELTTEDAPSKTFAITVEAGGDEPTDWKDIDDNTDLSKVPGLSEADQATLSAAGVKAGAIAKWAAANGNVEFGKADINLNAFILDVDNTKTAAELQKIVDDEITADMVAALADGTIKAGDVVEVEGYPNAVFTFVKVDDIDTDANLFKLKASLKTVTSAE